MRHTSGWKWSSIIVLSTALLVSCGAATLPPAPILFNSPTVPPSLTATPTRGDQMSSDPLLAQLVAQARADLARRLGLSAESFQLTRAEAIEWPDTSLGCPRPGTMYAQVITPGYLIVLEANGKEYDYHSDGRRVSLCAK